MTAATRASAIPKQFYWNGVRVPYVAPWSNERTQLGGLMKRYARGGVGLGYTDEADTDRRDEVLWVRETLGRGKEKPNLAGVHALRQRRCMVHRLCQVCGGPVVGTRRDERFLFVLRAANGAQIAEGEVTSAPPVHEPCAREAVRDCPHLRDGWAAALVGYAPAWGVAGVEYDSETLQELPPPEGGGSHLRLVRRRPAYPVDSRRPRRDLPA